MLNEKNIEYVKGLFTNPSLDIADAVLTVGATIKIGSTTVEWAVSTGDLGGTPSAIDCTPLASLVKLEKAGIQEQEQWEVTYVCNRTDMTAMYGKVGSTTSETIEVTLPNGDKLTNSGVVSANRLTGLQVNNRAEGVATINLSGAWTYTAGN